MAAVGFGDQDGFQSFSGSTVRVPLRIRKTSPAGLRLREEVRITPRVRPSGERLRMPRKGR